ncbi:hypothetical protein [Vulcanisaeta souniana]|uniref:nucleotide-binding protein n=1 Tax=Vulcanisaeta souniana TaxID=164452 RepID=UPI000B0A791A|nr:hypothetical protein [Vulcanisaeta souniana]
MSIKTAVNLYIVSTMSDSGKTAIVSALLRVLSRRSLHVTPFKAQNMSLNSYPSIEGGEIALAQAMQAYVAGLMPSVHHNPILIKPMTSDRAEYIILGKPRAQLSFNEYLNDDAIRHLAINAVKSSIRRLKDEFDLVVGEGAGSAYEPTWQVGTLLTLGRRSGLMPVYLWFSISIGGVVHSFRVLV